MQVLKKNSNNGCDTQLFLVLHEHVTNGNNNVDHCESWPVIWVFCEHYWHGHNNTTHYRSCNRYSV